MADAGRRAMLRGLAAALALPAVAPATAVPALLTRPVPVTGESLPVIGLGTWLSFDVAAPEELAAARETLGLLVAGGGSLVDSSPMYGRSESVLGRLAADLGRNRLFLATKVWTEGREAGIRQAEASMARLGARRLDLLQIHNLVDAATHGTTLRDWRAEGRIRYWGISHYQEGAYGEVERFMKTERPDFLQINYSLGEPASGRRLLPLARDLGIAVIANRPFAAGMLFERVRGQALPGWAGDFGASTWAQFFLKWILADPAVTCTVPATRNPRHMADNLAAGRGPLPDPATRGRMLALLAR